VLAVSGHVHSSGSAGHCGAVALCILALWSKTCRWSLLAVVRTSSHRFPNSCDSMPQSKEWASRLLLLSILLKMLYLRPGNHNASEHFEIFYAPI